MVAAVLIGTIIWGAMLYFVVTVCFGIDQW